MAEDTSLKAFFRTWGAWLGIMGVVLGLSLVVVAVVTGWGETLPTGQNAIITGLGIAVGSAVSALSYRYLRTIVMQVAGGITALVGLWAVIGPFILAYPLDSTLLVVSVLVGVLTTSLTGFALISASPIDDAAKPLNDIFAQKWRGWSGMPGLAAGLLLLALALLASGEASSAVKLNIGIIGAALASLSAICAFGYGRLPEAVVQLSGWLTILVGFWALVSAFVFGTVGSALFLVTVFTALLTVLTTSYAMLTTPTVEGTSSLFDISRITFTGKFERLVVARLAWCAWLHHWCSADAGRRGGWPGSKYSGVAVCGTHRAAHCGWEWYERRCVWLPAPSGRSDRWWHHGICWDLAGNQPVHPQLFARQYPVSGQHSPGHRDGIAVRVCNHPGRRHAAEGAAIGVRCILSLRTIGVAVAVVVERD